MNKKRLLPLLLLALLCISAIILFVATFSSTQAGIIEQPQGNTDTKPPAETFVVPENPLGILGLMSALAVAFGIFNFKKKRQ